MLIVRSAAACALLSCVACIDPDVCDPGQVLDEGHCIAADAGASDGGADAGVDAATDGCASGEPSTFGDACVSSAECGCDTDLCWVAPGAASALCTRMGCDADKTRCPLGFVCVEATSTDGRPWLCAPL